MLRRRTRVEIFCDLSGGMQSGQSCFDIIFSSRFLVVRRSSKRTVQYEDPRLRNEAPIPKPLLFKELRVEMATPLTSGAAPADEIESQDFYYKIPQVRSVEFASKDGTIATLEGEISVETGDAIMTGSEGERWPIRRFDFEQKYRPHGQTRKGEAGEYVSEPAVVTAAQLRTPKLVHLSEGRGSLNGRAGDWLVTYGHHDQAIVAPAIFSATYRRIGVPVDIGLSRDCLYAKPAIDGIVSALRHQLKHTCFHVRLLDDARPEVNYTRHSLWCLIQEVAPDVDDSIPDVLTLSVAAWTLPVETKDSLPGALRSLQRMKARPKRSYIEGVFIKLAQAVTPRQKTRAANKMPERSLVKALAEQLFELDHFNAALKSFYQGKINPEFRHYMPALEDAEPVGDEQTFLESGVIADRIANRYQLVWQKSVFGLTKDLAERKGLLSIFLAAPTGLVQWGLLSAFIFTCFTEFHDGCETIDRLSFLQCSSHVWRTWVAPVSLAAYLLVVSLGWLKWIALKAEKVENKHQDYRLLAEYMRVQYVWAVLGIDKHVTDAEPPVVPSESGWVVSAARALRHHAIMPRSAQAPPSRVRAEWANAAFLVEQKTYHDRTLIKRREDAIHHVRRYSRIAVVSSISAFVVLLMLKFGMPFFDGFRNLEMAAHFFVVVMVISLAVWAALHKVIDLYAWEIEAQRGKLVRSALQRAITELKHTEKPVHEIFFECGSFFCADQAAWHALRRAKPIEGPGG